MATYFHGTHNGNTELHNGICLAETLEQAAVYATGNGRILVVEVDDDLQAVRVEGYDHDTNTAPGDDGAADAEAIWFEDEDERGREHDTLRLMTEAATSKARIVAVLAYDAEEEEWI